MNIKFEGGGGVYIWYCKDIDTSYGYYGDIARSKDTIFEISRGKYFVHNLSTATSEQLLKLIISIFEAKKIIEEQ